MHSSTQEGFGFFVSVGPEDETTQRAIRQRPVFAQFNCMAKCVLGLSRTPERYEDCAALIFSLGKLGPQFDCFFIKSERAFEVAFGMGVLRSFKQLYGIGFAVGVVNGLSRGRSSAYRNQGENDDREKESARALKNHL